MHISLEKKRVGYIIHTINCYPRNGELRHLDFMHHKLYHPSQYQYLQHPILWVVLNISTINVRARLIRVQHNIHSKAYLVRNSDNIKYKMQKLCNENWSLKSTDLLQTQRLIKSWSISAALVPYSLRFSQIH